MAQADSVPFMFDNMKAVLNLTNKAIVDMDGGNGDLLKIVSSQYIAAHRHCADAWIDASRLLNQMKKENIWWFAAQWRQSNHGGGHQEK